MGNVARAEAGQGSGPRRAATPRITDQELLEQVARQAQDPGVIVCPAPRHITDPAVLEKIREDVIPAGADQEARLAILRAADSQTVLTNVAGGQT